MHDPSFHATPSSLSLTRGHLVPEGGGLGADGEERGHPEGHPGGNGVHVQPEAHPRHHDDERCREVRLHQVVAHVAPQLEHRLETAVVACGEGRRGKGGRLYLFFLSFYSLLFFNSREELVVHGFVLRQL